MEVRLRAESVIRTDHIVAQVTYVLHDQLKWVYAEEEFAPHLWADIPLLRDHVERIFVSETGMLPDGGALTVEQPGPLKGDEVEYDVHVYKTLEEEGAIQGGLDEDEAEDCPTAANFCSLPSAAIEGLWEK